MKDRLTALALCAVMALSPFSAAWAAETPVSDRETAAAVLPAGPEVRETVSFVEEEGPDGPAGLLDDAAPDYAGAEKALIRGLLARSETISLVGYRIPLDYDAVMASAPTYDKGHEELDWLVHKIRYRYGALFHFTGGCSFSPTGDKKYVRTVTPDYSMTAEEYTAARAFYEKTLDDIVAQIPEACGTNERKILFVHDYLATHYAYDHAYQNYDVYRFFKDGKGVCQAYMLAFSALMDKLDIPVSYVESDLLNHAWNVVQLEPDGPWYHLDVTWDDPTIYCGVDEEGYGIYADMPNGAKHDYFLISDARNEELRMKWAADKGLTYQNDQICGLDTLSEGRLTCPDDRFEAFYKSVSSPIVYVPGDESWYYVSSNYDGTDPEHPVDYRGIYRWDPERGDNKLDRYESRYSGGICGLVEHEGSLFFSVTDGVHRYELSGGSKVDRLIEVSFPVSNATRISGLTFDADGTLSYIKQESQDKVTVADAKPWHALWDGDSGIRYYYNFGAVAVQVDGEPTDHIFLAWHDPETGELTRLVAARDGTFGVSGEDKGKNIRAYRLEEGTLKPLSAPFVIREVNQ